MSYLLREMHASLWIEKVFKGDRVKRHDWRSRYIQSARGGRSAAHAALKAAASASSPAVALLVGRGDGADGSGTVGGGSVKGLGVRVEVDNGGSRFSGCC